jgi:hypothetical protein
MSGVTACKLNYMDVEKKNNLIITKMFTVHTTELSNGGLN